MAYFKARLENVNKIHYCPREYFVSHFKLITENRIKIMIH